MTRGCRLVYRGFMNVAMCSECVLAACNDAEKPPKQGCWRIWSLLIMCYIIRRCSRAPDVSILAVPRRAFPAEAFYSLSRFVARDAQVFSADAWIVGADARPRKLAQATDAAHLEAEPSPGGPVHSARPRQRLGFILRIVALRKTRNAPSGYTKFHERFALYCCYSSANQRIRRYVGISQV